MEECRGDQIESSEQQVMTNHGSLYTLCNIVLAYIYEKIIINIFILVFVLDLYPSPLAIQRILEVAFTAAAEAITQG